jgi:hypothetical protein
MVGLCLKVFAGRFKETLPALNKAKYQHSPDSWYTISTS